MKKEKSKEEKNKEDNINEDDILSLDYTLIEAGEANIVGNNSEETPLVEDPDTLIKSVDVVRDMYLEFGKEFSLEMDYDAESVLDAFSKIATTEKETVFNIVLAKRFSKVRLAVFSKMLLAIPVLVDRITQKDILESNNIELSVKLLEKIISMMDNVNTMYEQVKIKDADVVLKQLSYEIENKDISKEDKMSKEDTIMLLKRLRRAEKDK